MRSLFLAAGALTLCAAASTQATAAVTVQNSAVCGLGNYSCSDYAEGIEFLPPTSEYQTLPSMLLTYAELTIDAEAALSGEGMLLLQDKADIRGNFDFSDGIIVFIGELSLSGGGYIGIVTNDISPYLGATYAYGPKLSISGGATIADLTLVQAQEASLGEGVYTQVTLSDSVVSIGDGARVGELSASGGALSLSGTVSVSAIDLSAGESDATAQLDFGKGYFDIGTLGLGAGTVTTLAGFEASETVTVGYGAIVIAGAIGGAGDGATGGGAVYLKGNAALAVGQSLRTLYAGDQAGFKSLIGEASLSFPVADKAVLVTTADGMLGTVEAGALIYVGASDAAVSLTRADSLTIDAGAIVGADGRWIIDCTDLADASEEERSALSSAVALDGAQLLLWNWDGVDTTIQLDESWAGADVQLGGTQYWADFAVDDSGHLTIDRIRWSDVVHNHAPELIAEAERMYYGEDAADDGNASCAGHPGLCGPGYAYLSDIFASTSNYGRGAMSSAGLAVDSAVYLPAALGSLQASEMVHRAMHRTLADHDPRIALETKSHAGDQKLLHWWVDAQAERRKGNDIMSGTNWGFDADIAAVNLGFDWQPLENWIFTLSVSGGTADIDASGRLISGFGGEVSAAGIGLAAAYTGWQGLWQLALTYTQMQTEAKKVDTGYRLISEPDLNGYTLSLSWRDDWALSERFWWRPLARVSMNYLRMKDATVDVNGGASISGEGFALEADDRWWADFRLALAVGASLDVMGLAVQPAFYVAGEVAAGDTDWTLKSRLVRLDGATSGAVSSAGFYSTPSWLAEVGFTLHVAGTSPRKERKGGFMGIGAKETGKMLATSRELLLSVAGEYGARGTRGGRAELKWREFF